MINSMYREKHAVRGQEECEQGGRVIPPRPGCRHPCQHISEVNCPRCILLAIPILDINPTNISHGFRSHIS